MQASHKNTMLSLCFMHSCEKNFSSFSKHSPRPLTCVILMYINTFLFLSRCLCAAWRRREKSRVHLLIRFCRLWWLKLKVACVCGMWQCNLRDALNGTMSQRWKRAREEKNSSLMLSISCPLLISSFIASQLDKTLISSDWKKWEDFSYFYVRVHLSLCKWPHLDCYNWLIRIHSHTHTLTHSLTLYC